MEHLPRDGKRRLAKLRLIADRQGLKVMPSSTGLFWLWDKATRTLRSPRQGVTMEDLELLILLPEDDPRAQKIWASPTPMQDAE